MDTYCRSNTLTQVYTFQALFSVPVGLCSYDAFIVGSTCLIVEGIQSPVSTVAAHIGIRVERGEDHYATQDTGTVEHPFSTGIQIEVPAIFLE